MTPITIVNNPKHYSFNNLIRKELAMLSSVQQALESGRYPQ